MDKGSDGDQNEPKRVETTRLRQWCAFLCIFPLLTINSSTYTSQNEFTMDKGSDSEQNEPKRVETTRLGQWCAFFCSFVFFDY